MRHLFGVAIAVAVSSRDLPAQLSAASPPDSTSAVARVTLRNPRQLTAQRVSPDRRAGAGARMRLEWDQVPDVHEYVLSGRWATAFSWAMQSREFRVSERNAAIWNGRRVAFEVTLPEGSYSWRLVALFGPDELGDFDSPTILSFEIR